MKSRQIRTHEDGFGLTERCTVYAMDAPHAVNGANHVYHLDRGLTDMESGGRGEEWRAVGFVCFQHGPRDAADSTHGTLDGAVLAILIDRFEGFQRGPFACAENEEILGLWRQAQELLKARARSRAARGVLGKNVK